MFQDLKDLADIWKNGVEEPKDGQEEAMLIAKLQHLNRFMNKMLVAEAVLFSIIGGGVYYVLYL